MFFFFLSFSDFYNLVFISYIAVTTAHYNSNQTNVANRATLIIVQGFLGFFFGCVSLKNDLCLNLKKMGEK